MQNIINSVPLMQTPMRDVYDPALLIKLCQKGIVGTLDATELSPKHLAKVLAEIKAATVEPFCVHLTVPQPYERNDDQVDIVTQAVRPYFLAEQLDEPTLAPPYVESFKEQMQVVLEAGVAQFQFSCGIPALHWFDELRQRGITLIGTATHLDEAKILERVGVDAIVAQGLEAFGERTTFMGDAEAGLIPCQQLVTQCVTALDVPVIANGGIQCADSLSKVLNRGAVMAQAALPIALSKDSSISQEQREALNRQDATILTNALTGRLARASAHPMLDDLLHYKAFMLPYPLQLVIMRPLRARMPIYFTEKCLAEVKAESLDCWIQSLHTPLPMMA